MTTIPVKRLETPSTLTPADLQKRREDADVGLQFAIRWAEHSGMALAKFSRKAGLVFVRLGPAAGRRLPGPVAQDVVTRQILGGVLLLDVRVHRRSRTALPLVYGLAHP